MTIRVTPQGPYVVDGLPLHRAQPVRTPQQEPVAWDHQAPLAASESYALCRCGGSDNKPFCDGSYLEHEWDGTETAPTTSYDERAKTHVSAGITVRDDRGLCEHAGFCGTKLTNVWNLAREGREALAAAARPDADEADVAAAADSTARATRLAAMIDHCPSGALTYRFAGQVADQEPALPKAIAVTDDGPLWVTGGVVVTRSDGTTLETRNRVTLCRCGASKNKPLCDGSHAEQHFTDPA